MRPLLRLAILASLALASYAGSSKPTVNDMRKVNYKKRYITQPYTKTHKTPKAVWGAPKH